MGVKRAVDLVLDMAQRKGKESIYTYGPLIHNPQTIELLRKRGITPIRGLDEISSCEAGARLISKYPLGYGSINKSFNGLQSVAEIPHEHQGQVHSGWVDFGLAFGVPGLLLLLSSMIAIIYLGVRGRRELGVIAAILSLTLMGFCLIAEMSYKQYFESWIFMMTFCATVVALPGKPKMKLSAVR